MVNINQERISIAKEALTLESWLTTLSLGKSGLVREHKSYVGSFFFTDKLLVVRITPFIKPGIYLILCVIKAIEDLSTTYKIATVV